MLHQSCVYASALISYGGAHTCDKDNRASPLWYHNLRRLSRRVKYAMYVDVIQALHSVNGIPSVDGSLSKVPPDLLTLKLGNSRQCLRRVAEGRYGTNTI